jgi:exosortase/archaeosortase family protein
VASGAIAVRRGPLADGSPANTLAVPPTKTSPEPAGDRKAQIRFALTFVGVAAVLLGIYCYPYERNGWFEHGLAAYLQAYARVAGTVLGVLEPGITITDRTILGRFSLVIVKSCDGMEPNILLLAAVLAFPAAWSKRAVAAAIGLPVLIAVNIIRICTLYFIGIHLPAWFEFVHLELWPLLFIAIAAFTFVGLASFMKSTSSSPSAPTRRRTEWRTSSSA